MLSRYTNISLALELLMIESGLLAHEDTGLAVTGKLQTAMHKLEDRFTYTEMNTVESWLFDLIDMPGTFGMVVRGTTHAPAVHAACVHKMLTYMREICNDHRNPNDAEQPKADDSGVPTSSSPSRTD